MIGDMNDYLLSVAVFGGIVVFLVGILLLVEARVVQKGERTIVINAVLVSTLECAVTTLKDLGLFSEVVQVQVSRSYDIAGSIMFRPVDPVWIIVARGAACS